MQQHGSKYFARRQPSPDPGDGVNRSKVNIFKTYLGTYQIQGNYKMFLQTLPHPLTLGDGSIGQKSFFKTWSCCISNKRESQTFAADPLTP